MTNYLAVFMLKSFSSIPLSLIQVN